MYNILYFGSSAPGATSLHRANALRRLGHHVEVFDPSILSSSKSFGHLCDRFNYHTGYRFIQKSVVKWLTAIVNEKSIIDIIWVDGGEFFGRSAIQVLKNCGVPIVLFNHDDPTGPRDYRRFYSLRHALPFYDLVTAVRSESVRELSKFCSGKILKIWRTYDEVAHSGEDLIEIPLKFRSEVCFIGTWIRNEHRDEFLLNLINHGIPIAIWGSRWNLSPNWAKLKGSWRGGALSGEDYVYAIRGSKVCLGLLSKGNRDLHTTRSMEIPYAGGVLCAERTSEHLELYKENVEAVFWGDLSECVKKCNKLIDDENFRESIRNAGHARSILNRVGSENICTDILKAVFK